MIARFIIALFALVLAFAATGAAAADLVVTKTGGGQATVGQTKTFVITAGSVSLPLPPGLAVTVTDTLPPGFTQISASGSGWACSVGGQIVTCTRSNGLAAGASFPAITVTAVVGSGPSYTSCAQVAHAVNAATQPDQIAGNNTACVSGLVLRPRERPR